MSDQILTIKNKKQEEFLRKSTEAVLDISDPKIAELIKRMKEILIKRQGSGLAANQIGESKRIFIAQFEGKIYAFINPQIVKTSKKNVLMEEGCLSVPGIVGLVNRSQKITVQAFNELGKPIKLKAKDILARICQHEIDHLFGVLFIDRSTKLFHVPTNEKTAD
ncbi:MAG: peptide deformylase [bacterium]|nr:peptide deformylase [bacterium]